MDHGAGELAEARQVQSLAQVSVPGRVHHRGDRVVVRQAIPRQSQHLAHGPRQRLLVLRRVIGQDRHASPQVAIELAQEFQALDVAPRSGGAQRLPLGRLLLRDRAFENCGVRRLPRQELLHHATDHEALLEGSIRLPTDAVVAQERQAADGVIEVGEGGDRQDVARHLLRLLMHLLVGRGGGAEEQPAEVVVRLLLAGHRPLVHLERLALQGRHGVVPRLHSDISLADLLGVVEGVAVQERPEELAADVVERELEVGVLQRRVVPRLVEIAGEGVASPPALLLLFG